MRRDTDKKLLGAAASAIVVAVPVLALAALFLVTIFAVLKYGEDVLGTTLGLGVLLLYALIFLAVAVGVFVALRQRWKEVKGGEEEEAKKY